MRVFLLHLALVPLAVAGEPHLVHPDPHKQLVLDPRVIASVENARLVPGTIEKEPRGVLLPADKPWENATNNLYPNVLWDEDERVFKLWYKCVLADPDVIAKMDAPSTVHDVGWYLLYATSRDGLTWEKPALGLHKFDGDARTNIVARDCPNVGVFKDPHDADAARRYKMIYDVGLGQMRARFSPDGIHWSEPVKLEGFSAQHGDTHNNARWDERLGRYVAHTKLYLGERLVARAESRDFIHWENVSLALRSSLDEGRSRQTYCLPAFPYANVWLGTAMMYDLAHGRAVDAELAWSADTVKWQRVAPGVPLIPRGAKDCGDSMCIYGPSGPPIAQDGKLLIFYGGSDTPHLGWKRHCLLQLARLRLDGWAGYEPVKADAPAVITTRPLIATGAPLRVSADVRGSLRVSVESLTSEPITADVTDGEVRWTSGDFAALKGRTVQLRFELRDAKLYALSGFDLAETAVPEPMLQTLARRGTPPVTRSFTFDADAEGWQGLDPATHRAAGGHRGGFLEIARAKSLPFAFLAEKDNPLAGSWPEHIGGTGARIRFWLRAPKDGGHASVEIFAREAGQWFYERAGDVGPDWREATATLRWDWTDAEAIAAGWRPSVSGFSWRDTITHVGRIVLMPAKDGAHPRFDLDDVTIESLND